MVEKRFLLSAALSNKQDVICAFFFLYCSACMKIQSWKFVCVCGLSRRTVTKAILCAQKICTDPQSVDSRYISTEKKKL